MSYYSKNNTGYSQSQSKYNPNISNLYRYAKDKQTTVLRKAKYFNPWDKVIGKTGKGQYRAKANKRMARAKISALMPASPQMFALRNLQRRYRKTRLHNRKMAAKGLQKKTQYDKSSKRKYYNNQLKYKGYITLK